MNHLESFRVTHMESFPVTHLKTACIVSIKTPKLLTWSSLNFQCIERQLSINKVGDSLLLHHYVIVTFRNININFKYGFTPYI